MAHYTMQAEPRTRSLPDAVLARSGAAAAIDAVRGTFTESGQAATLTYAGAAGAILFQSDWSTGPLGQTNNALRDTNQTVPWSTDTTDGGKNGNNEIEVVSSSGLDFPSANCLRVLRPSGVQGQVWCEVHGLATPAVGEKRFYRLYVRVAYADVGATSYSNHHPVQNHSAPNTFNWRIGNNTNGTFKFRYVWDPDTTHWFVSNTSSDSLLLKNTSYRVEWMIDRISSTQCDMALRIYNSSNTLLYDDGGGYTQMLRDGHLSNIRDVHHTLTTDITALAQFECGSNGGDAHTQVDYHYFAAAMIRSDTWCGAYA